MLARQNAHAFSNAYSAAADALTQIRLHKFSNPTTGQIIKDCPANVAEAWSLSGKYIPGCSLYVNFSNSL
jgi:hypothetical protein